MPTYENGRIPADRLIVFAKGYHPDPRIGYWEHALSPATYARHLALVKRAKDRTGRHLMLGSGWSAYRPYDPQVVAWQIYGIGAAWPGTSSHGGFWEGKQTLAMDYSNWGFVYGWDQDAFFADCRAVGLSPGLIMRTRGYPDEPWHVVDLNPWSAVPAFDGIFTPFPTTTIPDGEPEEEEDDMAKTTGLSWTDAGGVKRCALTNPASGYWTEWQDGGGTYNNAISGGFDTGAFVPVTESHIRNLRASAEQVRKGI